MFALFLSFSLPFLSCSGSVIPSVCTQFCTIFFGLHVRSFLTTRTQVSSCAVKSLCAMFEDDDKDNPTAVEGDSSSSFIGVMKPFIFPLDKHVAALAPTGTATAASKTKHDVLEHVFVDQQWRALGCTEGAAKLLSLTLEDIQNNAVMLGDLLPDLEKNMDALFSNDGMVLPLQGLPVTCRVQAVEVDIKPESFYVIQFSQVVDKDKTAVGSISIHADGSQSHSQRMAGSLSMFALGGQADAETDQDEDQDLDDSQSGGQVSSDAASNASSDGAFDEDQEDQEDQEEEAEEKQRVVADLVAVQAARGTTLGTLGPVPAPASTSVPTVSRMASLDAKGTVSTIAAPHPRQASQSVQALEMAVFDLLAEHGHGLDPDRMAGADDRQSTLASIHGEHSPTQSLNSFLDGFEAPKLMFDLSEVDDGTCSSSPLHAATVAAAVHLHHPHLFSRDFDPKDFTTLDAAYEEPGSPVGQLLRAPPGLVKLLCSTECGSEATIQCVECDGVLCAACDESGHKMPKTKTHNRTCLPVSLDPTAAALTETTDYGLSAIDDPASVKTDVAVGLCDSVLLDPPSAAPVPVIDPIMNPIPEVHGDVELAELPAAAVRPAVDSVLPALPLVPDHASSLHSIGPQGNLTVRTPAQSSVSTAGTFVLSPNTNRVLEKGSLAALRTSKKPPTPIAAVVSVAAVTGVAPSKGPASACGSRASKDSAASSGSFAGNLHDRLKVFAKSREVAGLSPGLQQLQTAILMVLGLLIGLSIARFFTVAALVASFSTLLSDVHLASRRHYLTTRIAKTTHALALAGLTPPLIGPDAAAQYQTLIAADAAELEQSNSDLYLLRRGDMGAENRLLYQRPNVLLSVIRPSLVTDPTPVSVSVTLWDAVKLFALKARSVAATDLTARRIWNTDADAFFVLHNGFGPLASVLRQASDLHEADTRRNVQVIFYWDVSFTVVGIVVVALVIFTVVKTHIWTVEDNKLQVLVLFSGIPNAFLKAFESACLLRIRRLDREREAFMHSGGLGSTLDEEDESDDDDDVAELNPHASAVAHEMRPLTGATKLDSSKTKKEVKKGSDGCSSKAVTLLKVTSLLLGTIAYSIAVYFVEFGHQETSLYAAPGSTALSIQRQVSTVTAVFQLQALLTQNLTAARGGHPSVTRISAAQVATTLDALSLIEDQLAFGTTDGRVLAPADAELTKLMFTTLCQTMPDYVPPTGCATFANGVLHSGLHNAYVQFVAAARRARSQILSTLAVNATDPMFINTSFVAPDLMLVRNMQEVFLSGANSFTSAMYVSSVDTNLAKVYSTRLLAMLLFLGFSCGLYVFYLAPLISELVRRLSVHALRRVFIIQLRVWLSGVWLPYGTNWCADSCGRFSWRVCVCCAE
jgi:hypothetical protein